MPSTGHREAFWIDYDLDGDLDLHFGCALYSRRSGSWFEFVDATGCASWTAWGDYDNDGDLDLTCDGTTTHVWSNDGGLFHELGAPPGPFYGDGGIAWGDFDRDGFLDLATPAGMGGTLWRNLSGHAWAGIANALPWNAAGEVASGDFDKDGDLDLALVGFRPTELQRNEGCGVFVEQSLGLAPTGEGSVDFGDYDNDGYPDLAICDPQVSTAILRNLRDGTFLNIGAALPGTRHDTLAWGDYDNDGDLDLLLGGSAQIAKNNGEGTFIILSVAAAGSEQVLRWGDYDNDGDLDLLLIGRRVFEPVTQIWRNDGLVHNTPPSAPVGLASSVANGRVNFQWAAATDAQTPSPGLSYNLRIGSSPGAANILSPMSDLVTGYRRLPAIGNAQQNTFAYLDAHRLSPGNYYWSVQAIDTAFAGGAWATEASFVIADNDSDGLPDWWEQAHGLNPAAAGDAVLDSDGDGYTNAEELAGRTDPQNPSSGFRLTATESNSQDLQLTFQTSASVVYRLERSLISPIGPWSTVMENVAGAAGEMTVAVPGGAQDQRVFYRLVVQE